MFFLRIAGDRFRVFSLDQQVYFLGEIRERPSLFHSNGNSPSRFVVFLRYNPTRLFARIVAAGGSRFWQVRNGTRYSFGRPGVAHPRGKFFDVCNRSALSCNREGVATLEVTLPPGSKSWRG
jgi:hypothetical protein